jgi:CRP-like cAMP-binding protein
MKEYLTKIHAFIASLPGETAAALEKVGTVKRFKKGECLLKAGETCRFIFFLDAGMARKYYLKNNKEIVTEFYFTDDIAISFTSYTLQQPADEYIQVLEDSEVTIIEYSLFQQFKKLHPALVVLDLMLTEYHAMWLEGRLSQLRSLTATERYRKLLHEHPQVIQKIQLTYIASYLGVSLETLSRIRARI